MRLHARRPFLTGVILLAFAAGAAAQIRVIKRAKPKGKPPKKRSAESIARDTLKALVARRRAAGHTGDTYENRDKGHSNLRVERFPGLRRHPNPSYGLQRRPPKDKEPLFGNSSTSSLDPHVGSNPRVAYLSRSLMGVLYKQYTSNKLYVYPEHRDYDPDPGDLYPVNTPYLLISRGSSGSDLPFLRAVAYALAALRPDVKAKLKEAGLLMPTVQMILRRTSTTLRSSRDYLTGRAHPPAFTGRKLDYPKIVQYAQGLRTYNIPPMVQLKVVEETLAVPNRDFFEAPGRTERICDTPCAIGRVFRGPGHTRKIVVSAADSYDINKKRLRFQWAVLQGDARRIRITPRDRARTVAEIEVPWHEKGPVNPGAKMTSSRVDIGVFVTNGSTWSAPAFVSIYCLPSEKRRYDAKKRLAEVTYDPGVLSDPRLTAYKDWRDVYHYDKEGNRTGWTRHVGGETQSYTADGFLVTETDDAGRPAKAQRVRYQSHRIDTGSKKRKMALKIVPYGEAKTLAELKKEEKEREERRKKMEEERRRREEERKKKEEEKK